MSKTVSKDIIPVFIKAVVFLHVGLSWMIKIKEQIEYFCSYKKSGLCKYGPCYDTNIYYNLYAPVFEYFFVTTCQDRL